MFQSNNARYVYTLKEISNLNPLYPYCKMKNGFVLVRESKSDEKLRITELDLFAITRTILFLHVFNITPVETIDKILETGQVNHTLDNDMLTIKTDLTINSIIDLLDSIFGLGFSLVAQRVVGKCFREYCTIWRYSMFNYKIVSPSAEDYCKLFRFTTLDVFKLSTTDLFILTNSTDFKLPLQQALKKLS